MAKNFIIKPDGLFPSTYSQMGRVLIPSKDCNNRKIARKFTEKGVKPIINPTTAGMNILSSTYISTFKRFDRPSPLISQDCQPCEIVSVPSVTDKTIYPCSLGKYSVTAYSDYENTIDKNYIYSIYPRITTSDYQLYQQYRVKNINNINNCCKFELKNGPYLSKIDIPELDFFPLFYTNCNFCKEFYKNYNIIIEKITVCTFKIISSEFGSGIITIENNNEILIQFRKPYILPPLLYIKQEKTSIPNIDVIESLPNFTGNCGNITIENVTLNNGELTIQEDGKLITFTDTYNIGDSFIFTNDNENFYTLIRPDNQSPFYLSQKTNCDCVWNNCECDIKLSSGIYKTDTDLFLSIINTSNCDLCFFPPNEGDRPTLEYIKDCEWEYNGDTLQIINDNKFQILNNEPYEYIPETSLNTVTFTDYTGCLLNTDPNSECSDNESIEISWDVFTSILTITNNMITETFSTGSKWGGNNITIYWETQKAFYTFIENNNEYKIKYKETCDCQWKIPELFIISHSPCQQITRGAFFIPTDPPGPNFLDLDGPPNTQGYWTINNLRFSSDSWDGDADVRINAHGNVTRIRLRNQNLNAPPPTGFERGSVIGGADFCLFTAPTEYSNYDTYYPPIISGTGFGGTILSPNIQSAGAVNIDNPLITCTVEYTSIGAPLDTGGVIQVEILSADPTVKLGDIFEIESPGGNRALFEIVECCEDDSTTTKRPVCSSDGFIGAVISGDGYDPINTNIGTLPLDSSPSGLEIDFTINPNGLIENPQISVFPGGGIIGDKYEICCLEPDTCVDPRPNCLPNWSQLPFDIAVSTIGCQEVVIDDQVRSYTCLNPTIIEIC